LGSKRPVVLGLNKSRVPAASRPTTGSPDAIASSITCPRVSVYDGNLAREKFRILLQYKNKSGRKRRTRIYQHWHNTPPTSLHSGDLRILRRSDPYLDKAVQDAVELVRRLQRLILGGVDERGGRTLCEVFRML
jgi:hypothetical protein